MKSKIIFIVFLLSFLILLTCCAEPQELQEQPESLEAAAADDGSEEAIKYTKITPQEALDMMSGDVIILDVRTQEEFESGYIRNAILIPDYEIKEKAESILTDKNQTILIYCRSGRRSAAASRELIAMGYTSVFDFGGILDWTGEIIREGN